MKTNSLLFHVVTFALAALSACGDGASEQASCRGSTPCGGNIVGTWNITSSCIEWKESAIASICPGASVKTSNMKLMGNATYNANMTYMSNTTVSGSMSMVWPAECLMQGVFSVTCADIQDVLGTDPAFPSATCAVSGSGCECALTLAPQTTTETGIYTATPAGMLTMIANEEAAEESDYCVKGKTLTISAREGSSMMAGSEVSGAVVFEKQ